MTKYNVGDIIQLTNPKLPIVGLITEKDSQKNKYLVRFSAGTQDYFSEEELMLYIHGKK
ncbi:MAG: hypothetical protein RR554_00765 [Vagococcus sp.]|uniref:hypothetical protein n=1 Tax=Vagococcus sp. TaxID=1933889 RepID=UPI002FCC7716